MFQCLHRLYAFCDLTLNLLVTPSLSWFQCLHRLYAFCDFRPLTERDGVFVIVFQCLHRLYAFCDEHTTLPDDVDFSREFQCLHRLYAFCDSPVFWEYGDGGARGFQCLHRLYAFCDLEAWQALEKLATVEGFNAFTGFMLSATRASLSFPPTPNNP